MSFSYGEAVYVDPEREPRNINKGVEMLAAAGMLGVGARLELVEAGRGELELKRERVEGYRVHIGTINGAVARIELEPYLWLADSPGGRWIDPNPAAVGRLSVLLSPAMDPAAELKPDCFGKVVVLWAGPGTSCRLAAQMQMLDMVAADDPSRAVDVSRATILGDRCWCCNAQTLLVCSGCGTARYCCIACQANDIRRHVSCHECLPTAHHKIHRY